MAATIIPFRPRPANDDAPTPSPSGPAQIISLRAAQSNDPTREFAVAYHAATIARAEHDLLEVKFLAMHWLNEAGAWNAFGDLRHDAYNRMWAATERVAMLPAMSACQFRMKKSAIGNVWLRAKGERYNRFRKSVAADAARLGRRAA